MSTKRKFSIFTGGSAHGIDCPCCFRPGKPVFCGECTPQDAEQRLVALRALLKAHKIDGYIVPTEDAHSSEYVAEVDQRRSFISGFTGSAGTALITADSALLWTDSRYFLQVSIRSRVSGQLSLPSVGGHPAELVVGADEVLRAWGAGARGLGRKEPQRQGRRL